MKACLAYDTLLALTADQRAFMERDIFRFCAALIGFPLLGAGRGFLIL